MEGPPLLASRWGTTRQGGQSGFLFAIELAMSILPFGPILQSSLDSLGDRALAQPFDRGSAHLDRLGDLGIAPLGTLWTSIRLQENASPGGDAG
jgi:hypothetical protein